LEKKMEEKKKEVYFKCEMCFEVKTRHFCEIKKIENKNCWGWQVSLLGTCKAPYLKQTSIYKNLKRSCTLHFHVCCMTLC
jgi:hypothetical protein